MGASRGRADLFAAVSAAPRRRPWALAASLGAHAAVLATAAAVFLFLPAPAPEPRVDYIRLLLYDPPPPPPPPPLRLGSRQPAAIPAEAPEPAVRPTPRPALVAEIEAPLEPPDVPVAPSLEEGSPTGAESGAFDGMEEGMEGGVVGGVPGGVPGGVIGGVIGGTGSGPVPVLDYDSAPRPISMPRPEYPHDAFTKRIEGTVVLEILIDDHGHVVRARVVHSIPPLDHAALAAVRAWVFLPAVKRGRAVPTVAQAPITFRIY